MEVTSFIWAEVHSKSMYLLKTVISQLSQVFEPSPQGLLLQQILRYLLGSLTGPLILTPEFLALETRLFVTCCMEGRVFPLKVILVLLISWSSRMSFLSLSAIELKINFNLINGRIFNIDFIQSAFFLLNDYFIKSAVNKMITFMYGISIDSTNLIKLINLIFLNVFISGWNFI